MAIDPSPLRRSGRRAIWLALLGGAALFLSGYAFGQQAPAEQYNAAIQAFLGGNYPDAAQRLTALITQFKDASEEVKKTLEPAYYTLGAAYFNAKDYDNAIKTFREYKTKFPAGEHLANVIYSLANAYYSLKKPDEAITELKLLENGSPMQQQALFLHGFILNQQEKFADAAVPLETIIAKGLKTSQDVDAALLLASIYTKLHQYDKAGQLLSNIKKNFHLVANKVRFNTLIIDLGDKLFADGLSRQATEVYRVAQTRAELSAAQETTIAELKERDQDQLELFRKTKDVKYVEQSTQLRAQIADAETALKKIDEIKDFEPNLLLRLGRAYYESGRQWESLLVYEQLLKAFPDARESELTTFGRILSLKDLDKFKEALQACDQYLQKYPQGAQRSVILYLRGNMALESKDYPLAIKLLTEGIAQDPKSEYVDAMNFLIAEARFAAADYPAAIAAYQGYLAAYPGGGNVEDSTYRIGMAATLSGDYENALKYFDAYLKTYPRGSYEPDVRYRIALAKFAQSNNAEALADSEAWLKAHPGDKQAGEVLSLEGDIYAAQEEKEKATEKYAEAVKAAAAIGNDEVLNYSLNEVGKIYQTQREWDKTIALFEGFIKQNPKNPAVVSCAYFLARARSKLGQDDQAKKFLTEIILQQINNPANSSVERLITQLAQLVAKRPLPAPPPTPTPVPLVAGAPTPVPTPTPSPEELKAKADADEKARLALAAKLTKEAADEMKATISIPALDKEECVYRARKLFALSELMRIRRQNDEASKLIGDIGSGFRPQDLSAALLGLAGDWLLADGKPRKAGEMYDYLAGHYPDSEFADFGYVGLGEVAYREKDYKTALRNFKSAKEDVMPGQKLKDAYLGEAKSLLALEKLKEAEDLFKLIAGNKQWRGEATAISIYSLGEIEEQRKEYAKAIAYYQRVYVAYMKYPEYVAKAYLHSARCFELLGKKQEAINTYREMLRNEKLVDIQSPSLVEAQQRLKDLGQSN